MRCEKHRENEAVAFCLRCGRGICKECCETVSEKKYCNDCAVKISKPPIKRAQTPNKNNKISFSKFIGETSDTLELLFKDNFSEIKKSKYLLDTGDITEDEFDRIKQSNLEQYLKLTHTISKKEIKAAKSLLDENIINESDYEKLKRQHVSFLLKTSDPIILITESKEILDKKIINRNDYDKIKKEVLETFNSNILSDPTNRKLNEISSLKESGTINSTELDILNRNKIKDLFNRVNQLKLENNYRSYDLELIYNQILEIDPQNVDALKSELDLFENEKYIDESIFSIIETCNKLLDINPDNCNLWIKKAEALDNFRSFIIDSNDGEDLDHYDIYLPDEIPVKLLNKVIIKSYDQAISLNPHEMLLLKKINSLHEFRNLMIQENLYFEQEEYQALWEEFIDFNNLNVLITTFCDEFLVAYPLNINALYIKAVALEHLENYCEAFECYKQLTKSIDKYIFIEKFVNSNNGYFQQRNLDDLRELLINEGVNLSTEQIQILVDNEIEMQKYMKFKERMEINNPNSIENYINNFLELYSDIYINQLRFFILLISSKGLNYDKFQILSKIEEIKRVNELDELKRKLLHCDSDIISLEYIDTLDGYNFEQFLKLLFKEMGFEVENTPFSQDQGADLIIRKYNKKTVVQAKRWDGKVNNKAIQEISAAIKYYDAEEGIVVTNSLFTSSAVELAKSNNILLYDRKKLENLLNKFPVNKNEFEFKIE